LEIGFQTTLELIKVEYKIIMACRNIDKARSVKNICQTKHSRHGSITKTENGQLSIF